MPEEQSPPQGEFATPARGRFAAPRSNRAASADIAIDVVTKKVPTGLSEYVKSIGSEGRKKRSKLLTPEERSATEKKAVAKKRAGK